MCDYFILYTVYSTCMSGRMCVNRCWHFVMGNLGLYYSDRSGYTILTVHVCMTPQTRIPHCVCVHDTPGQDTPLCMTPTL